MPRATKAKNGFASSIKIEKGVPMPEKWIRSERVYPWLEMAVGDSFVIHKQRARHGAYTMGYGASKRYAPKKFTVRKDANGEMRCWRVK